MSAWIFQDSRQKQKLAEKCPWSAGWIDPAGRRKSKRIGARSRAEKYARKVEGQLASGTYQDKSNKQWCDFRKEYESRLVDRMDPRSRETAKQSLQRFEDEMKPKRLASIDTAEIEKYIALRSEAKGQEGRKLSKATINKELRYLRAILRVAHDWGYVPRVPKFKFLKLPGKLPVFVSPGEFAALYGACASANLPRDVRNVEAADWWRGLLVVAYMTGWRIGAILALRWADVDLDAATAVSLAEGNKGKRDQLIPLHPLAVEHLQKLAGAFDDVGRVFPWNYNTRTLWTQFHRLQKAAKIKPAHKAHFGFHDLRRGFATQNASTLDLFTLQTLMQHRSLETTRLYVNMAQRLKPAVERLFVPTLPDVAVVAG